jgi:hypothetical protein
MPQFFVKGIDSTIEEYIDRNEDMIRNRLLSNELKKKRCKVSKTFRVQYNKRDILRLKH